MATKTILHPWQLLLVCLAGWLQREQQQVIEFYQAQLEALLQAARAALRTRECRLGI